MSADTLTLTSGGGTILFNDVTLPRPDPYYHMMSMQGWGLEENRLDVAEVMGSDVGIALSDFKKPRTVTIAGLIQSATDAGLWAAWHALELACTTTLGSPASLHVTSDPVGPNLLNNVFRSGPLRIERMGPYTARYQVSFISPDPVRA